MDVKSWENMTPEEKKVELFLRQKNTLDLFLERNAISKVQYEKSLGDLREKMGMWDQQKIIQERIVINGAYFDERE